MLHTFTEQTPSISRHCWKAVQEKSIAQNLLPFLLRDALPTEALDLGLKTTDSEKQTLQSVQVQMKEVLGSDLPRPIRRHVIHCFPLSPQSEQPCSRWNWCTAN